VVKHPFASATADAHSSTSLARAPDGSHGPGASARARRSGIRGAFERKEAAWCSCEGHIWRRCQDLRFWLGLGGDGWGDGFATLEYNWVSQASRITDGRLPL
jgi:hypothetical protein